MSKNELFNFLNKIVEAIGSIIMFLLIIIVFYQVATRYIFKTGSPWSEEIARYLLIWLSMIGASMSFKDKEFLKIELYIDMLNSKCQNYFYLFDCIVTIFVSSILSFYGYQLAILNRYQYSPSLTWLSLFWVCIAIPIGWGLITIYTIKNLLVEVTTLFNIKRQ